MPAVDPDLEVHVWVAIATDEGAAWCMGVHGIGQPILTQNPCLLVSPKVADVVQGEWTDRFLAWAE